MEDRAEEIREAREDDRDDSSPVLDVVLWKRPIQIKWY